MANVCGAETTLYRQVAFEQLRQQIEDAARVHARMQAGLSWQVTEAQQGELAATLETEEERAKVAQLEEVVEALQASHAARPQPCSTIILSHL